MIATILLAGIFSGFAEPPRTVAPWCYWLWENSHVDAETIAADAADIAATGFGGVLMSDSRGYWDDDDHIVKPAPKMVWGSDEWLDTVAGAVRACARNGLKFTMNIAASGGHLKGQVNVGADNPKFLKCRFYLPGDPFETPDIPNYRDVAAFAVRTAEPAERSDWANAGDGYYSMEGNVGKREGACDFKVRRALEVRELASAAEGAALGAGWTILRFGSGTIPGQEVDIDVLDRAAVRRHLDRTVGRVAARVPDLVGADKTFTHVYNVSWEGSMPTWSATFEADFAKIEGYALRPLLPILAGYALAAKPADAFMRDYRHARGVMMCEHLYGTVRAWAHERGMGAYSESGGPWGDRRNPKTFGECDQLLFLSNNDIPQGEFWPDSLRGVSRTGGHANRNGRYLTKGIVSTAHVYGRPIASAESFTHMERHWSVDPAYLKPIGDQALADGINRLVWHTYTSSPKSFGVPGLEFFAGSHINRNVTWHRELPAFVRYLTRCQYLLQRGEPVVDVAVLTGDRAYAGWGNATNGRLRNLLSVEMPVKVPKGYAYDAVNDDALAKNPDLLRRYRVVFDARKPENRAGTVPVGTLQPDVETAADWTWSHRRDGANDIYFVVGEGSAELKFRRQANVVEIWDAVTGTAAPADWQRLADGRTRVNLTLPQGGSAFVMFLADGEQAAKNEDVTQTEELLTLSGPWQVSFAYHEGISARPPASVVLTNLVDFTTRDDLRHFAGTAVYRTTFGWKGRDGEGAVATLAHLSLGLLPSGLAHVYVNGKDCGTVWCAPWEADVSAAVRDGANELEIRYVNNWYNRLVGDCALPEGERVTRSALHYWPGPRTWPKPERFWAYRPTLYSGYCADDPLQPSGLLGPVRLLQERTANENPRDYMVFLPTARRQVNEHFHVLENPKTGRLLAFWTQESWECSSDMHVMFARSEDGGRTWSPAKLLWGSPRLDSGVPNAVWQLPMVSRSGRLYCVWNRREKAGDGQGVGLMIGAVSDDDGETWSTPVRLMDAKRWCSWQRPMRLGKDGKFLTAVSIATEDVAKTCFLRFENIDDDPDVKDLKFTILGEDRTIEGEEASIVKLPDGRLFAVMRSRLGTPLWTVSTDGGETWSGSRPVLDETGRTIRHPRSPCPLYDLAGDAAGSGRYLALFTDEFDPQVFQWEGRGPLYRYDGAFDPAGEQPVRFAKRNLLMPRKADNHYGNSCYSSFTCRNGEGVLWYPDNKRRLYGVKVR